MVTMGTEPIKVLHYHYYKRKETDPIALRQAMVAEIQFFLFPGNPTGTQTNKQTTNTHNNLSNAE